MARLRSQIFRRILIQKVLSADIPCFINAFFILHSDNIGCACMNDELIFADYLHGFVTLTIAQKSYHQVFFVHLQRYNYSPCHDGMIHIVFPLRV